MNRLRAIVAAVVGLALLAAAAGTLAQIRPRPIYPTITTPRAPTAAPPTVEAAQVQSVAKSCPSVCQQGLTRVYQSVGGACELQFTIPCFPGSCDAAGKACRIQCGNNQDCAPSAVCHASAQCVVQSHACYNKFKSLAGDGKIEDCEPYACQAGQCKSICTSDQECSPSYGCKLPEGRCVFKGG